MRYDLRLHGRTSDGKSCQADISVYAASQKQLLEESHKGAETAAWRYKDPPQEWVAEGSTIVVENVEMLTKDQEKLPKY